MQTWRFLYTKEKNFKMAITKTGAPIEGKTSYVVTHGSDYAECLTNATAECKFKETQLIGASQITEAKLIEYAYQSSTYANAVGYGDTGCWFVKIYKTVNSWEVVKTIPQHFTDKDAAKAYADQLAYPYHSGMKYFKQ